MGSGKQEKRARGLLDYVRAKGRLWILVGGVLLGVLLLLLGNGGEIESGGDSAEESGLLCESAADLAAYRKGLEDELESLCESVAGVGHAEVMVTLGSGHRVIYVTDDKGEVKTTGTGGAKQPVYRTVQPPLIEGVGIVCRGGDNPHVQRALTDLISTTLGIAANRVCVTGK